MKTWKVVLLSVFVASAAFAITAEALGKVDFFAETNPAVFIKGIYIGPRVGANRPQANVLNKITRTTSVKCDYDFPAVTIGTGVVWQESSDCAMVGVRTNDVCFSSTPTETRTESDGGTNSRGSRFGCVATAADVVRIQHFPPIVADGGEGPVLADPIDAGYTCRCFSNQ